MPCHGIWKLGRPHCNGAECPNQPEFNSQHNTSDSKHSTERPTKEQRAFQCNPSSDLPCMFLVVTCECRSLSLSLSLTHRHRHRHTDTSQANSGACLPCSHLQSYLFRSPATMSHSWLSISPPHQRKQCCEHRNDTQQP